MLPLACDTCSTQVTSANQALKAVKKQKRTTIPIQIPYIFMVHLTLEPCVHNLGSHLSGRIQSMWSSSKDAQPGESKHLRQVSYILALILCHPWTSNFSPSWDQNIEQGGSLVWPARLHSPSHVFQSLPRRHGGNPKGLNTEQFNKPV